jgi:hypothetical protein
MLLTFAVLESIQQGCSIQLNPWPRTSAVTELTFTG